MGRNLKSADVCALLDEKQEVTQQRTVFDGVSRSGRTH